MGINIDLVASAGQEQIVQAGALADVVNDWEYFVVQMRVVCTNIFCRAIAEGHGASDNLRAGRRLPDELTLFDLRIMVDAPPENDVIKVTPAKQGRELAVMAERIG